MPDSVGIVFRFRLVEVHNLVVTNRDLHGVGIKPIPCPWTFGRSHSDRSHIHETTSPPCFDPHIINHTTVGLIRHECDSDIIVARGEGNQNCTAPFSAQKSNHDSQSAGPHIGTPTPHETAPYTATETPRESSVYPSLVTSCRSFQFGVSTLHGLTMRLQLPSVDFVVLLAEFDNPVPVIIKHGFVDLYVFRDTLHCASPPFICCHCLLDSESYAPWLRLDLC